MNVLIDDDDDDLFVLWKKNAYFIDCDDYIND
jgi:hypothetical protein